MKKIVMCTLLVLAVQWPATGQNVSRALDAAMDLSNASSAVPARMNIDRDNALQILGEPSPCADCDKSRLTKIKLLVAMSDLGKGKIAEALEVFPMNIAHTNAWGAYIQKIFACGTRANLKNDCGTLNDALTTLTETVGINLSMNFDFVNVEPPEYECAAQQF
ncbi:hypothetical protein AGMMS49525_08110 [Bacteroidia bacterium]|nr:hypothetical protein AGMMS49525_08110 [Bacteroidia bacterium]